ncbi:hypothetical protein HDU76_007892, partial [Blyttiomyces sp. JEL0837]
VVIVALAAVTGPVGAILGNTSESTTNDLSNTVMLQAVDIAANQIQDVLDQPNRLLQVAVPDSNVKKAMIYNFNNLKNETDVFDLFGNMAATSPWLNGLICVSYPNLFGLSPPGRFGPNLTAIASYRAGASGVGAKFGRYWVDWSTNGYMMQSSYNTTSNSYDAPAPLSVPYMYIIGNSDAVIKMLSDPLGTDTWYSYSYTQAVMIGSVTRHMIDNQISTKHPLYSCSVNMEANLALGALFTSLKVTPNSKLFMIDSTNGILLANSVPNSIFWTNYSDPYLSSSIPWTPTMSNDTLLNKLGQTLLNLYGNYSKVPYNNGQTLSIQTPIGDGQEWFINTKYLARPNNWLLVIAIPRNDFFSNIDAAKKRVLIISISVAVAGVVLVSVASFLALRPLYKLTEAMKLLTKMDFSALEGNILKDRSLIAEVRGLQITFSTMCKAFAAGIRKNKNLMTTTGAKSTMSHTSGSTGPGSKPPSRQGSISRDTRNVNH